MYRRRRIIADEQPKGIGGQILGLSLFIMLLAFFMILNSISSYEQARVKSVLGNLENTFASRLYEDGNENSSISKADDHGLGEGGTIERIEAMFRSQIPATKVVRNKSRGTMTVVIPVRDFEDAINTISQAGDAESFKAEFVRMLVALVRSDQRSVPYRMDITYHTEKTPAALFNQDPQAINQKIESISRIAARIENAGLSTHLMSISIEQGNPDTVEMDFKPYRSGAY